MYYASKAYKHKGFCTPANKFDKSTQSYLMHSSCNHNKLTFYKHQQGWGWVEGGWGRGGGALMQIHNYEVSEVTLVQPQQPGRIDNQIWRKRITQ